MNIKNSKGTKVISDRFGRQGNQLPKIERIKKPVIFILMGIVFVGCIYLIFKPSKTGAIKHDYDMNVVVPDASGRDLQKDKQKAYELAMLEQKEQEKKNAMMSLSDYWLEDSAGTASRLSLEPAQPRTITGEFEHDKKNDAINSYKNAQVELKHFYEEDAADTRDLRRQIEDLKKELLDKEARPSTTVVEDQLALMEKSYQMAAKYLPHNVGAPDQLKYPVGQANVGAAARESFKVFAPVKQGLVSSLPRIKEDSCLEESVGENVKRLFVAGPSLNDKSTFSKNGIKACVQENITLQGAGRVKLRILESARANEVIIPEGHVLIAMSKIENDRLELKISSVELHGRIIPVDITIYDIDGQPGIPAPYSQERNGLKEIAANMSQSSGTSLIMTRSAGQQIAGDLSRGVVQGVSGYLSKKIRSAKVAIKAGYLVYLVSK